MGLFDWLRGKRPPKPTPPRPESEMEAIRRREGNRAEVRARIGKGVHPPGEVSGEELFGGRGVTGRLPSTAGKRGHGYRTKRGHVAHVDAAFDGDEHAAFLLGIKVECRSSWIATAQWHEETSTLTLTTHASRKPYDFPGVDFSKASAFSSYGSKGRWYWEVWKGQYQRAEGEFPLLDQMPMPQRRSTKAPKPHIPPGRPFGQGGPGSVRKYE